MDTYAIEARPLCGQKLPKVNFKKLYDKSEFIDTQTSNDFDGICQFGSQRILECYSFFDEYYTPFEICSLCGKCSYRLSDISNPHIVNFNGKFLVGNGKYTTALFLEKEFSKLIQKENPQSFVYLMTDGHYIKIGKANKSNISKRDLQLQTGNSQKIFPVAIIPCATEENAFSLEHSLHTIYGKYHTSGEWYDLKDYIDIDDFHKRYPPSNYINEPTITVSDYCKK